MSKQVISMAGQVSACLMDGRTDGRSDGRSDGRTVGRTDGRTGGQTDGQSDGRTDVFQATNLTNLATNCH